MRQDPYHNLRWLRHNPYPGRGIIIGTNSLGATVQVYWIMGRSENSRNRILTEINGRVFTEAADPAKMRDPSLIIYNAMNESRKDCKYAVSNGNQTCAVLTGAIEGKNLTSALGEFRYEPDEPNYTPRITGICSLLTGPRFGLAMLRIGDWSTHCERFSWYYEDIPKGFGYCITTYNGDGEPLPSFVGEPLLVPLEGNEVKIAEKYWSYLNGENRVSLAVKTIGAIEGSRTHIINKYSKVSS